MPIEAAILHDFPAEFDPLPPYRGDGSLPPGDFRPSRADFETRFVNVEDVTRRTSIYDGWNNHRTALIRAGLTPASRQLLNGSYTTAKHSPGDIDLAVEVPVADVASLATWTVDHPIVALLQGPLMKPAYLCDAYPIYALPKDDPDYDVVTRRAIEYWTKWFGRTRTGSPKGRVWASCGGLA
jgi:hypothetical protein